MLKAFKTLMTFNVILPLPPLHLPLLLGMNLIRALSVLGKSYRGAASPTLPLILCNDQDVPEGNERNALCGLNNLRINFLYASFLENCSNNCTVFTNGKLCAVGRGRGEEGKHAWVTAQ